MPDCQLAQVESWYRGKSVVITGASGYIATAIISRLAGIALNITRISRSSLPPQPGCVDLLGEISNPGICSRALPGADVVFHLAGQTSFYRAADDPESDFTANVQPMRQLLETSRREGIKPFIVFSGSSTQLGLPAKIPVNEAQLDAPITVYDLHKLVSEKLLEGYSRLGFASGVTLRLSNVYGPGPKPSAHDRGVINAMISRGLSGQRLTYYGAGQPIRDYLFIDDLANAFLAAGQGGEKLHGQHFVLGSGQGYSIRDAFSLIGARIEAQTGRHVEVVSIPEPTDLIPIESRMFVADSSAFRFATGWAPQISLADGIDRTINCMAMLNGAK